MKDLINYINRFFGNLHHHLQKARYWILACVTVLTLFFAAGMDKIIIDESMESYLRDDDPVKCAYDRFRSYFGSDENLYVVYRAKEKDIFSDSALTVLRKVHDELVNYRLELASDEKSPLDHIKEVKSLINVKYMEAHDDVLYSRNFIGDRLPENEQQRRILKEKALNHPDYPYLFVSENAEYGAIVIRTDFNAEPASEEQTDHISAFDDSSDIFAETDEMFSEDMPKEDIFQLKKTELEEYPAFVNALNQIIAKDEYKAVLEFYPVGNPVIMDFFATAVFADISRLMSYVLLLIIVVLFILFRSFCAILWPVIVVTLTIIWTMGLIGWSGIHMSAMIQVIVFLALSVGIADTVHILSGYLFFRNKKLSHNAAIDAVMKKTGLACLLTSITTAIGLISLVLVPLTPISTFGVFASLSVLLAFLFTVTLLPLMLDLWAPVSKNRRFKKTILFYR
ncbi:MAG: hypothetical protein OMM_00927 [Candidatus Magnetoglobus multicellularis str. Araruama]|uniref:SSD domain-containing protein n=1 Tax=Candidatus Magnetoglobus multicellularis str. Araruama TaxID=890399 RepID=A0A1V1PF20_9BACT|nr:MAG: hypothetical protein OMM_00927 [Candidatus Magnetoglobus multicellularis str. Araruama]